MAPWVYAMCLFIWLGILVFGRSFPDGIVGFDLASISQSLWLLGEGKSPNPSLLNGESYLAQNAAYVIYPLSQITRIFPIATTLLFLQSFALSLTVVPIFKVAKKLGKLHFGTCTAIVFVYGIYSSLHSVNLSGFSPATLALPAIVYVLYLGLSVQTTTLNELSLKFHLQYWPLIAWILICRADLGLAIAGFGILLIVEKKRYLGLITFGASFMYLLLAIFLFQTLVGDDFVSIANYRSYGSNPLGVFWEMISNPANTIRDLRTEENIRSLIGLLAPLVFLPLTRLRYVLPVLPLYFFYLIADVPVDVFGEAEQAIPVIAFLFVALVFAFNRIGSILVERVRVSSFLVWVLIAASVLLFIQDSPSSFYRRPWQSNQYQTTLEEAVETVPADVRVAASTNLLSSLVEREHLFEIKSTANLSPTEIAQQVRGVDLVLIDSGVVFTNDLDRENFIQVMLGNGWKKTEFGDPANKVFRFQR